MLLAGLDGADVELDVEELLKNARDSARRGKTAESLRCYRELLKREPQHLEALYRVAIMLRDSNPQKSLALLNSALALAPENPALHGARALAAKGAKRELDALESFAMACIWSPADLGALYNYGLQCADMLCHAQAESIGRHLLSQRPDWLAAHYLLVRGLTGLDADPEDLDASYAFLVRSEPLNVSLRFARGLHQLRMGNFGAGWDAQEWRWDIEPVKSSRLTCKGTRWAGGPLDGKHILVLGEQGFGDILQFARYLPLLVERGAKVTLQLDENRSSLKRLLSRIKGVEVMTGRDTLPECDLYCPMASLPFAFGTTIDTIPMPPYLSVGPSDIEGWTRRLSHLPRPWVGVCWGGSAEHFHDVRRSLPLHAGGRHYAERQAREERILSAAERVAEAVGLKSLVTAARVDAMPASYTLEPLLNQTTGSLIALQVGPRATEVNELPAALKARVFSFLDSDTDFYGTACLVQALDSVICVDTSTAHLAGALGKTGTLIKPAAPEWRWMERGG